MNIVVFDTETTSLDHPFCYDIGYVISDTDTGAVLLKRSFVNEQVWHNDMCFCSAYYANKRPIYVAAMRKHEMKMDKFGYICQQMIRDFSYFDVQYAFAYNSPFDERVFNFNCDWFKVQNPFDNLPIHDIRAYAVETIVNDDYKKFCDDNGYFTESGNYSTTAEIMQRYIMQNTDFVEAHTALNDAEIETDILFECIHNGADITVNRVAPKSIERNVQYDWSIRQNNKEVNTIHAKSIYVDKTNHKINFRG